MLPIIAQDLLKHDLQDAEELAAQGKPTAGYQTLVAGLERVNAIRAKAEFPWAAELVRCYEEAMEAYAREHHLKL